MTGFIYDHTGAIFILFIVVGWPLWIWHTVRSERRRTSSNSREMP